MKNILIISVAAFLFSQISCVKKNDEILTNNLVDSLKVGLIAYYPFASSFNDSSGNSNHGIGTSVLFNSDRFGNKNAAAEFNGKSSGIVVKSTYSLNLIGNFSIVVWVKPINLVNESLLNFLLSKNDGFTNQGTWHFMIAQTGTTYNPHYNADPCFCWAGGPGSNISLPLNEWSLLVITYDQSKPIKYYVNGELKWTSSTFNYTNKATNYDLYIGRASGFNGSIVGYYNGLMDDIRLYSRSLTDSEIKYLFKN